MSRGNWDAASEPEPGTRVAHLTTVHSPFDSRIFERQCRSLARAGYAVSLVAPHRDGTSPAGVDLVELEPPRNRLQRWRLLPACYRAALFTGARLFHLHDPELLPVGVLLQRRGGQVVADLHENLGLDLLAKDWIPGPLRPSVSWLGTRVERWATSRLAHVVAATPSIAAQFARGDATVVANFPEATEFDAALRPYTDRPLRVLYAGELAARRGSLVLPRLAERLRDRSGVEVVAAGRFSSPAERRRARAETGWDRIDDRGVIPFRQVVELIGNSRVGLVLYDASPNHLEAWPRKLFEYMAGAVPVVYSDLPGMRRLLEPLGCGIAVAPDDVASAVAAVEWLLDHPEQAESMGRRGRDAVDRELNWDHEREKLLALYQRLLAPRSPRRSGSKADSGRD